jgi:hypothetical protein
MANELDVTASLGGGSVVRRTFGWGGAASGTLELTFPSGYPAGQAIDVRVDAQSAGRLLGSGSVHEVLQAGCTAFGLAVSDGGDGGLGSDDGAAAIDQASPPDLLDVCTVAGSDGIVCAPTDNPCLKPGVCAAGHCGPVSPLDDGTAVPGGQYLDRCCHGNPIKLNSDDHCGGCGLRCLNGFHCSNSGASDSRMWWCGCNANTDCWSNCCGTGSNPGTAGKVCAPSSCAIPAVCEGCPPHSTCEMAEPHYYCHY